MVRRLIGSVLLAAGVVAGPVLAAAPAQAVPKCLAGYQCTRTYYADRTYEQVVGGATRFCDGSTDQWGTTTAQVLTEQVPCG